MKNLIEILKAIACLILIYAVFVPVFLGLINLFVWIVLKIGI